MVVKRPHREDNPNSKKQTSCIMTRHVADMVVDHPDRYEMLMRFVRYRNQAEIQRLMVSWGYKDEKGLGYEGQVGTERITRWWYKNFPTEQEIKELNARMFTAAGILPAAQQEWQLYNTCRYLEKLFERLNKEDREITPQELMQISGILKEARSLSNDILVRHQIQDAADIALETVEIVYLELVETFKDTPILDPLIECFRGIRKRVEAKWRSVTR